MKNPAKEKESKNETKDYQKQSRKTHATRKYGDPEKAHHRQNRRK